MSQLIDIDPQIQSEPEPDRYGFGYYTFDPLPTLEVTNVETTKKELLETQDEDAYDKNLWRLSISVELYPNYSRRMNFVKIY